MSDRDEIREHSFDGIQEYDNDLPRWWVWLFWITILFSLIYPFIYDFGPGQFASETINEEVAQIRAAMNANNNTASSDDSALIKLTGDPAALALGKEVYATRCAACHAAVGEGLVGPNLTDDYWIHGGKLSDIRNVVLNGVLDKGMIAWKSQLSGEQVNAVVAYIWSLHGTSPANAKAPQGEKVVRE